MPAMNGSFDVYGCFSGYAFCTAYEEGRRASPRSEPTIVPVASANTKWDNVRPLSRYSAMPNKRQKALTSCAGWKWRRHPVPSPEPGWCVNLYFSLLFFKYLFVMTFTLAQHKNDFIMHLVYSGAIWAFVSGRRAGRWRNNYDGTKD